LTGIFLPLTEKLLHPIVLVILPEDEGSRLLKLKKDRRLTEYEQHVIDYVNDIMEPYNENLEVEPYEEDCGCIGEVAYSESAGLINPIPMSQITVPHFTHAYEFHPLVHKPNPHCGFCLSTGTAISRGNRDGRWDFWVIGGRWTGFLTNIDRRQNDCYENNVKDNVGYLKNIHKDRIDRIEDVILPDGIWENIYGVERLKLIRKYKDYLGVTVDYHT
jgi:hypothetical protein